MHKSRDTFSKYVLLVASGAWYTSMSDIIHEDKASWSFFFIFLQPCYGDLLTLPAADRLKPLDPHSLHFHSCFSYKIFFFVNKFQKIRFAWSQMVTDVKVLQVWPTAGCGRDLNPPQKPLPVRSQRQKNIILLGCFAVFLPQVLTGGQWEVPQSTVLWPRPRWDAPVGLPFTIFDPLPGWVLSFHLFTRLKCSKMILI